MRAISLQPCYSWLPRLHSPSAVRPGGSIAVSAEIRVRQRVQAPTERGQRFVPLLPRQTIDDVRERTNIVDIVRRYVELKRAGTTSWKGLCPFHSEKTPSFHVHEQRQFFHCFGCTKHGDVFQFLVEIEHRSFLEVLRDLARDAGIELPDQASTPAERRAAEEAASERERMLKAVEEATRFFEAQLRGPAGSATRRYLEIRGISKTVCERFRVGHAPAGWQTLHAHLSSRQIPDTLAERLGLISKGDRGCYDFFRDRVMLPVLDRQGRPIAFSSRLLDPDAKERKYLNSPDSPLFHKRGSLYGLHAALDGIRRNSTAIVVEGNFDVLSLHEAGIEEAVAPMGTALTVEQIQQLARIAKRIVVVFDGDEAGLRATEKSVTSAVEAGLFFAESDADARVVEMPEGMDPDDFVRARGADAFRSLVEQARPMLDYLIHRATQDATVPGRASAARRVMEVLAKVRNPLVRDLYVRELAAKLGVPVAHVTGMAQNSTAERPRSALPVVATVPPSITRTLPADEIDALALVAEHPELLSSPLASEVLGLLRDSEIHQVYATALTARQAEEPTQAPVWLDGAPADIREAIASALMDGRWARVEAPQDAMRAVVRKLRRSEIDAELAEAQRQHREAIARGDEEQAKLIVAREMELIRRRLRPGD